MLDFIERHKRILFIGAIIVIVCLSITLLLVSNKQTTPQPTNSDSGELNYSFLKEDISEQDKYLMLLGKILTEGYGTYSQEDIRGLLDVKNQSTSLFAEKVQDKIDIISSTTNIITAVDPESISLERSSDSAVLTMSATTTDNITNEVAEIVSVVKLSLQDNYWLATDIVFESR